MHASTDRLRGRMWVCERGTTQDAGIGFRARYCVDRFRANDSQVTRDLCEDCYGCVD